MTPREELLAAIDIIDAFGMDHVSPAVENVIRRWLQLEADQHWHPGEVEAITGTGSISKWEQPWWTEEVLAVQPCIQMARLITGGYGPIYVEADQK
jgi:hypothetical protein